jgi:hypothetical protein
VRDGDVVDIRVITKNAVDGILEAAVKNPEGYGIPFRCHPVNPTSFECNLSPIREGPQYNIWRNSYNQVAFRRRSWAIQEISHKSLWNRPRRWRRKLPSKLYC